MTSAGNTASAGSRSRIAVLASGRGSNLQAIVDAIAAGTLDAEVVAVLSDKPEASALQKVAPERRWARSPKDFADRAAFDAAMGDALAAFAPDWLASSGTGWPASITSTNRVEAPCP